MSVNTDRFFQEARRLVVVTLFDGLCSLLPPLGDLRLIIGIGKGVELFREFEMPLSDLLELGLELL